MLMKAVLRPRPRPGTVWAVPDTLYDSHDGAKSVSRPRKVAVMQKRGVLGDPLSRLGFGGAARDNFRSQVAKRFTIARATSRVSFRFDFCARPALDSTEKTTCAGARSGSESVPVETRCGTVV